MIEHKKTLLFAILLAVISPAEAFAVFLPHDYPAKYTHMIGRVLFFFSMIAITVFILRNKLEKEEKWKYFLIAIIFLNLWNLTVFFGRFYELPLTDGSIGWDYFMRDVIIFRYVELVFYLTRFDFILLNVGMFFLYLSLRVNLKKATEPSNQILLPIMLLPFLPIAIVQIVGGLTFLFLSFLCLTTSWELLKREKDNVLWNYKVWLTSSLFIYSISRSFAYIFQHLFIVTGNKPFWESIEPVIGSINSIFLFWVSFVTLFFIVVYKAYLKIREEEKKLERVNLDLMQLNKELETLVAERTMALMGLTVADRVRNPAVMIGALCKRIIKKEEKLNQDILDIIDECKRLEAIVGEFENLLKTRQSVFEYGDLNEIINSIFYLLEQEAHDKQISFILNLSEKPVRINLQRNLLRSAIYHVIRNAIEATPPGGEITITTLAEGEKVFLIIADTGRGIHPENLDKIFDPFFTTKELRFGMGLPLVKQIVSEHLGELSIKSELGKGTTVEMVFPIRWKPPK